MASRAALIGVLVLVPLALAGCSGGSETAPPATSAPDSVPSSPAPPAAPASADPTSAAAPAPPLPRAADGDNVATCSDGACEVLVSGPVDIPLTPQFRLQRLRVDSIGPDGVTVAATGARGGTTQSAGCSLGANSGGPGEPPSLQAVCRPGGSFTVLRLTVRIVAANDQAAVLRLTHR